VIGSVRRRITLHARSPSYGPPRYSVGAASAQAAACSLRSFPMQNTQPVTATLHILTPDPQPPDNLVAFAMPGACAGEMTCDCVTCQAERVARVKRGVRATGSQPWQPRARKAA
jgi:hypothetical protein